MGQTISTISRVISYPFKAVIKIVAGENPNSDMNITNSNIQEFNSNFASKEENINFLINGLFSNLNSSLKTFNVNMLFPYSQLLADNLVNHGNLDDTGEFSFEREKIIFILEKIMKLYLTEHAIHNPEIGKKYDNFFKAQYNVIKDNFKNISTSFNVIQPVLNKNDDLSIDNFKIKIDEHFNKKFLEKNSIVQYLNLLLKIIEAFKNELDEHIRFFEQKDKGVLGNLYDYSVGFFTWLSRSGYSYKGTANFYTYFKNNNILLLQNKVERKIESFTNAYTILKTIRRNHENLDCHIKNNINDKFVITFHLKNNTNLNIEINLGNYTILNYTLLCNLIKTKVNDALQDNKKINFDVIYYDDENNEKLQNTIFIICDEKFTLKKESSIMKILGWTSFIDVESCNRLNDDNEKIGYFTMAPKKIFNEQIGNIINYASRHNTMISSLTNFNTVMEIQHTQADNNN